jgi:hypothetical protein
MMFHPNPLINKIENIFFSRDFNINTIVESLYQKAKLLTENIVKLIFYISDKNFHLSIKPLKNAAGLN